MRDTQLTSWLMARRHTACGRASFQKLGKRSYSCTVQVLQLYSTVSTIYIVPGDNRIWWRLVCSGRGRDRAHLFCVEACRTI